MRKINSALIGFGDFTENVIAPRLKENGNFNIKAGLVHSENRIGEVVEKFGLNYATTDYDRIIQDPDIECVFIVTRHDKHKEQIITALEAGKSVFTEKPMAMSVEDAEEIVKVAEKSSAKMMLGFNRRFSPMTAEIKKTLDEIKSPFIINYRWINKAWSSGWPFDPVQGGGKLVSSGCHMIDLVLCLMGGLPESLKASLKVLCHEGIKTHDTASVIMDFGTRGLVNITTGELGAKTMPQERLEIFTNKGVIEMSNFSTIKFYDIQRNDIASEEPLKGFQEEFTAFYNYLNSDTPSPCGVCEGLNVSICVDACLKSAKNGQTVYIDKN